MTNRNIKEISKKAYRIFIGILLCLLSVSLCLNAGYCAKGVSFSFSYVLGIASYLVYAFMFVEGVFLIITSKGIGAITSKYFWFSFIFLIGLAGIITYASVDQSAKYLSFASDENQIEIIRKINIAFEDYFVKQPISMFDKEREFGCGLFGYSILALGNSIFSSKVGGLVLTIIFMVVGGLLDIIPGTIEIIRNSKKVAAEKKANPNSHKRIKNINVIKGARKIDPKTYHSEVSGAGRNLREFDEEILENPEAAQIPLKDAILIDEGFGQRILENSPEIESLDEFRNPIFDLNELNPKKPEPQIEEKYEPIGVKPSMDIFEEPEEEIVIPEVTPQNDYVSRPVRDEYVAPVKEPVQPVRPVQQQPAQQPYVQKPVQQPFAQPQYQQPAQPVQQPVQQQVAPEQPKKKERVNFQVIGGSVLETYETAHALEVNTAMAAERKEIINNTFRDFGVGAEVLDYTIGPSITRYNIRYNSNVSSRAVANLVQDISIRLNGVGARFESVIEGQSTSGLEIPNAEITTVAFKDVYEALPDPKRHPLAVAFGKNIKGNVIYADYDEFPHMLISGTTGSGKSVFVNSIICTLIMRNSPDDLKLVLVDPKKVEMSRYADMPHLLTPIITEAGKVKLVLDKLVDEMEYRYSIFSKNNATNIKEYNEDCEFNGNERIPYIVVILDEYADLVEQCKEISFPVVMLAQKARACGIHLMLSTQRPSTNVVTGVIKANMPTHVALMTANYVDSVTIIGEGGAEKLLGKGDMLVQSPLVSRVGVCRLQSCFINRREIIKIVSELKSKYPTNFDSNFMNLEEQKPSEFAPADLPEGGGDNDEETKYRSIKEWVMSQEYMSMSKIQRDCGVGFNRAGRFFNRLQQEGIVASESEGSKGCRVIQQNKFGDISDDDLIPTSEENSYIK